MKKFEYNKPEIHIHSLIIESQILTTTKPTGTETDEAFSPRFNAITFDDSEVETSISEQECSTTEYYQ